MGRVRRPSNMFDCSVAESLAGPAHILDLRLRSDDGPTENFGNELFNTDPTFPGEFAVVVDTNDQVCLDTVLSLRAIWSGPIVFHDDFECGDTADWSNSPGP
jgi:hypothetical protein